MFNSIYACYCVEKYKDLDPFGEKFVFFEHDTKGKIMFLKNSFFSQHRSFGVLNKSFKNL